jgi:hypothetical protein
VFACGFRPIGSQIGLNMKRDITYGYGGRNSVCYTIGFVVRPSRNFGEMFSVLECSDVGTVL